MCQKLFLIRVQLKLKIREIHATHPGVMEKIYSHVHRFEHVLPFDTFIFLKRNTDLSVGWPRSNGRYKIHAKAFRSESVNKQQQVLLGANQTTNQAEGSSKDYFCHQLTWKTILSSRKISQ